MSIIHISDLEDREIVPRTKVRFVHSENVTLAYWTFEAGALLPEHSHFHEQVTNILEGTFELTVEGNTETLEPGSVALLPSNSLHSGKAITECRILDVFYPIREDYR